MSFYIARYQEGRTWPEAFGFREPPYTEFFLSERPRLDIQFRWFDRVVPLNVQIDGTDLRDLPATFTLQFDGLEFKPKGELNLPQTFEIPGLETLEKQDSEFRLIAHDSATRQAREVSSDTDTDLTLSAKSGGGSFCLYASRYTPAQRLVLGSKYLSHVTNGILRTVLLLRYVGEPWEDRRSKIIAALEKGEFDSEEQRRLAAHFRFSEAIQARFKTLHRDAYKQFQEAAELLQPLVLEKKPTLEDAVLMYRACRALVEIWLRQDSIPNAGQLGETLGAVAHTIKESDPENADFQRMWADAVLLNAGIHVKLGDKPRAATELRENVATLQHLNELLPSAQRRIAYLQALTSAIEQAAQWEIADAVPLKQWKAALAEEVGDKTAEELTHSRSRDELPRWLEPADPGGWPTRSIKSAGLRYSLRIPKNWSSEFEVRGTSKEVEHLYYGKRDAEWLIVSFMDQANAESDMTNWVGPFLAMSGFPVLIKLDPLPKLRQWTYLGKLPGVAKKLVADEAHAYTGLAEYTEGKMPILGRMYIVMARRKTFAWKVSLSFETACFEGMPEDRVYSQDHVRAGAILGALRLGEARKASRSFIKP